MSPAATCSTCGTAASMMPGFEAPATPRNWTRDGGGWTCLQCQRNRVTAEGEDRGLSKQAITRELARFEIKRTPTAPPSEIVRRKINPKPSRNLIVGVRGELIAAGLVPALRTPADPDRPAGKLKPRRPAAEREAVEVELRRDPRRVNLAIADRAGLSGGDEGRKSYVARVRSTMETAGEIERWRAIQRRAA